MAVANKEGCEHCSKGYKGRLAILEVLVLTDEIKDAITANLPKHELRDLVYRGDVVTLLQDGLNKVLLGETTLEEILKIIDLENDVTSYHDDNLKSNMMMAQRIGKKEEMESKGDNPQTSPIEVFTTSPTPTPVSNPTSNASSSTAQVNTPVSSKEEDIEKIIADAQSNPMYNTQESKSYAINDKPIETYSFDTNFDKFNF